MKKLMALMIAFVLLLTLAVPAFANPSISDKTVDGEGTIDGNQPAPTDGVQPAPTDGVQPAPTDNVQPVPTDDQKKDSKDNQTNDDQGLVVKVSTVDTSAYSEKVKSIVDSVNDPEQSVDVAEAVAALAGDSITVIGVDGNAAQQAVDFTNYHLVTGFWEVFLTDGTTRMHKLNGNKVPATVKVTFDTLKGESKDNLGNYQIMLVDIETGEICLLDLNADSFDPETGSLTVRFPFLGAFALVQKAA